MTVKPLELRKVDGEVGAVINSLLSLCRYQADSVLLRELLGVPWDRANMGTPLSS